MCKRSPTERVHWSPADSRPPGQASLCGWAWKPGALLQANRWSLGRGAHWPRSKLGISLWGPSDSGPDLALASLWLAAVAGLLQDQPVLLPNLDSDWSGWPESTGGRSRVADPGGL